MIYQPPWNGMGRALASLHCEPVVAAFSTGIQALYVDSLDSAAYHRAQLAVCPSRPTGGSGEAFPFRHAGRAMVLGSNRFLLRRKLYEQRAPASLCGDLPRTAQTEQKDSLLCSRRVGTRSPGRWQPESACGAGVHGAPGVHVCGEAN